MTPVPTGPGSYGNQALCLRRVRSTVPYALTLAFYRHCERNEAIQKHDGIKVFMDCFVASLLAMTG